MSKLGKYNTLRVARFTKIGAYLDGEELGEILLPTRDVPKRCQVDQTLEVFLYLDSEDRPIATTKRPYATVGQVAWLKAVDVTPVGAFLNWGLPKDLLVPFSEQKQRMKEGLSYLVYVCLEEEHQRIIASARLDKFLDTQPCLLKENQEVELFAAEQTDMGYKVIINDSYWGLLYENEVFQILRRGQRLPGFVKKIRKDGKIDCGLHQPGYAKVHDTAWKILEELHKHNGFLPVTDKSAPEEIYAVVGVSKKTFKKAVGALYKKKMISIGAKGITLSESKGGDK
jgi:predicted RNA-binding protein (virulence factor B family)